MKFETKVRRILTNAAKIVARDEEDFSCIAINMASDRLLGNGWFYAPEREAAHGHYRQLFAPFMFGDGRERRENLRGRKPFGSANFWNKESDKGTERREQLKQQRVAALLHAAASYGA